MFYIPHLVRRYSYSITSIHPVGLYDIYLVVMTTLMLASEKPWQVYWQGITHLTYTHCSVDSGKSPVIDRFGTWIYISRCFWNLQKICIAYNSTGNLGWIHNDLGFAFFGRHLFSPFQVPDENATYILEPVTNEEYYQVIVKLEELYLETICFQDDQNIMWIQETVEVEQVRMQFKMNISKLGI